jgi:hypothetical protein
MILKIRRDYALVSEDRSRTDVGTAVSKLAASDLRRSREIGVESGMEM